MNVGDLVTVKGQSPGQVPVPNLWKELYGVGMIFSVYNDDECLVLFPKVDSLKLFAMKALEVLCEGR